MHSSQNRKSGNDYNTYAKNASILNAINAVKSFIKNKHQNKIMNDIKEITQASQIPVIKYFITGLLYVNVDDLDTIDKIIEFLGKREPIFKVLVFNFKNPNLILSSTRLFYTTFFDIFFLKQSKTELLERVKTILFTNIDTNDTLYELYQEIESIKDENEIERKILTNPYIYYALIYFINKGKIHFQKDKINEDDYSYDTKKLAQIIYDYSFVDTSNLSPMYYQLKFFFNEIDKKGQTCSLSETLLIRLKKIRQLKVPKLETLAANIISRNIALIHQAKIFKKMQGKMKERDIIIIEEEEEEKDEIKLPETFQERRKLFQLSLLASTTVMNSSTYSPPEEFWNPDDKFYEVDNCVLFKPQNVEKHFDYFDKAINYFVHSKSFKISVEDLQVHENCVEFSTYPIRTVRPKLKKIFYYDEAYRKWEIDPSFSESLKSITSQLFGETTSLVLFSNSFENDLIQLNSNLIKSLYPDLDEDKKDQIFVYALCGPQLFLLNYFIKIENGKGSKQNEQLKKPIFLLLHVPESKRKLKYLNTIIFQIYFYLSLICDIEVAVLNRSHYRDQINMIKTLNTIKKLYKESSIRKNKLLTDSYEKLAVNAQIDDNDFDSDSNDDNFSEDEDENKKIEKDDCFSKIYPEFYQKSRKYIILINSDQIHDNYEREPGNFVSFIKKEVSLLNDENEIKKFCHVHYINVNDPVTYKNFLSSLNEFAASCNNKIDDIIYLFYRFEMSQITSMYINLKNEGKLWKDELKKAIRQRFTILKKFDTDELGDFELIAELNNEVIQIYPSIDDEFENECNSIMAEIRNERASKNKKVLASELSISSQNSINYWTQIIERDEIWTDKMKENIINHHINFIKDEFFHIITAVCSNSSKRESFRIFEVNLDILEEQIALDRSSFDSIFDELEDKISKKRKIHQKIFDIAQQKENGTNYMIRERENVREIKATVEVGQLDVDIERDF